jgi:hypothetical protein
MKVYIVQEVDYEATCIDGVFDSEEKARAFIVEQHALMNHEHPERTGDTTWSDPVEECGGLIVYARNGWCPEYRYHIREVQ